MYPHVGDILFSFFIPFYYWAGVAGVSAGAAASKPGTVTGLTMLSLCASS
jgi:hypothetical protein